MDNIEDEFLTWANTNLPMLDKLKVSAHAALYIFRVGYQVGLGNKNKKIFSREISKANAVRKKNKLMEEL